MVGAINPTADKTFSEFQQKALAVGTALGANAPATPTYHDVTVGGQDGSLVYVPSVVVSILLTVSYASTQAECHYSRAPSRVTS